MFRLAGWGWAGLGCDTPPSAPGREAPKAAAFAARCIIARPPPREGPGGGGGQARIAGQPRRRPCPRGCRSLGSLPRLAGLGNYTATSVHTSTTPTKMRTASTLAALLLAGGIASAAPSGSGNSTTTTCAKGLYVLVARGTTEPQGAGVTGQLANNITAKIPGSKVEALVYPATFTDPAYQDSVAAGVKSMQVLVNRYLDACPDGKVAIMGYSQGAHVGMDAVCGGSGGIFDAARALPKPDVEKNVVAMVFFGDPTHVANVTYDKGTSIKNGLFERSNASVTTCKQYSDRLVSYCDTGDVYCDGGSNKKVHGGYVGKYGDEVVKYVVDKYNAATGGGNSTSSATGTATATTAAPTGSGSATATGSGGASATGSGTPTPTHTGAAAGLSVGAGAYVAPLVVMGAAAWAAL
ncbi:carbohydrate esterase family 5 protein [Purpureocillium lavendulum]|uniref:Carbohydrate esterase family 5 protein n=1 Tax=Purpureocillium lavendulum TaxID=1247861 RepID=A0AB34G5E6_9HYPO|nr:carbohydrate esterase family 5 protein [Purpureocillium lavendulum]